MKVTVFTKPDCQPCRATKRTLDRLGVAYEEVDLTKSEEAMQKVLDLGHQAAPVVYVDDACHWSGYRPDRLNWLAEQLLAA